MQYLFVAIISDTLHYNHQGITLCLKYAFSYTEPCNSNTLSFKSI